jgi:FAD synthase
MHEIRFELLHKLDIPISFTENVIKGQGLQSKFGYPTANTKNTSNIEYGLYLGRCEYGSTMTMVTKEKIETHIIDWDGDLYGKEISIELFSKFDSRGIKQFVDTIKE